MNHERLRALLPAYLDGELDLVTALEIEEHLATCAECARDYAALRELHALLADQRAALRQPAPPALQDRIQAALRAAPDPMVRSATGQGEAIGGSTGRDLEARLAPTEPRPAEAPVRRVRRMWPTFLPRLVPTLAVVATLVVVVFLALGFSNGWPWAPRPDLLAQEVETAHVRSLMANHLTDVTSTDQHTVKPWFDGKLDFSPPVTDLAAQGYPLIGGRLEYIDDHQAAALVYMSAKHIINLFIWPTSAPNSALSETTINGYHLISWNQSGMALWAVSDLESSELQAFAGLIQKNSP